MMEVTKDTEKALPVGSNGTGALRVTCNPIPSCSEWIQSNQNYEYACSNYAYSTYQVIETPKIHDELKASGFLMLVILLIGGVMCVAGNEAKKNVREGVMFVGQVFLAIGGIVAIINLIAAYSTIFNW